MIALNRQQLGLTWIWLIKVFPHMVIIFVLVSKVLLIYSKDVCPRLSPHSACQCRLKACSCKAKSSNPWSGKSVPRWRRLLHVSLMEIPKRLRDVARNLNSTLWRLKKEFPNDSLQSGVMLSLLHVQIQYVNDTITSALENYRGLTVTNRTKRGLIDGIGKLSNVVWNRYERRCCRAER